MCYTTRIFVAQPIVSAVSLGFVNCAFLPTKSSSTTPRAVAQAFQTKIGILSSATLASASRKGGQPTGVTLFDTAVRISTVASPANSMRTSFPASRSALAQTKGKFARVGFFEPTSPTDQQELLSRLRLSRGGGHAHCTFSDGNLSGDDARLVRQIRAWSSSDRLRAIFPKGRIGIGKSGQKKGEIMSKPIEKFSSARSEPQTTGGHPTREEIELRAHQIYLERGGAHGLDVEDWLQAERELREKHRKTGRMSRTAAI